MSDTTRQLDGLGSLTRVDPKKMVRRNRDTTPKAEPTPDSAASVAFTESPAMQAPAAEVVTAAPQPPAGAAERQVRSTSTSATKAPTARKAASAAPVKVGQARVNTYIDGDLRSRVVAAFRFTSHLEGESSFSEFVETALLNEAIRREEKYNAGEPYAAEVKLPRGRPVRG